MKIKINGTEKTINRSLTVQGLLEEMELQCKRVAVERNRDIVPQEALSTTALADGDELEIVHFVGGG